MSFEIISIGKEPPKSKEFEVLPKETSPERSIGDASLRNLGRTAKAASSTILGTPGSMQSMVESLLSYPTGYSPEQVREKISAMGLQAPGRFPTSQELKEGIEKKVPGIVPETEGEESYERGLETFVSLLMPGAQRSAINSVIRAGIGAGGGEAAANALKNFGFGEGAQNAARLGFAGLSQFGSKGRMPVKEGRIRLAGKTAGLTEEELAPLTHKESAVRRLGKFTTETEANRNVVANIKNKSSEFLNKISNKGKAIDIPKKNLQELVDDVKGLRSDMARSAGQEAQRKSVVDYLDTVIKDLETGNITGEHLINTYRDANRLFKQNMPHQLNRLQKMNRSISNTLSQVNPELGREFRLGNRLVKAQHDFIDNVGWEKLAHAWTHGTPAQEALGAIIGGIGGAAIGHGVSGTVLGAGASYAINKIANWLLTSPSAQGLRHLTIRAFKEDNPKLALAAYNSLKDRVKKELPEDYEKVDWELD